MSQAQALIGDLEAALKSGSTERRTEILRRVTDLFLGRCNPYSGAEVARFDTVILRLIGPSSSACLRNSVGSLRQSPMRRRG